MSLLGIDVGTSGCKAAVFSEDGRLLGLVYDEYDYQSPQHGWAELDSVDVWRKVKLTIRQAVAETKSDPVKAVCVSSLGETVVPVTAERKILGPALLNFDVRGDEYLAELRGRLPDEMLYQINGNTLGNQYALTKLKWLRQHQPDIYRQSAFFLAWSGFVSFMLGAEARVDYSLANRTLLFDLERCDWSDELLELAQLERAKLPPTVPSGVVIGTVANEIAAELGLPAGIPIVSGGHDQCCNGIGSGVLAPGQAMYGMGTYLCMTPVFEQRPATALMLKRGLNTEHHTVPGQYVSFLYNQGGSLVKWFRNTFAAAERQQAQASGQDLYATLLSEMPADLSHVMVLPHFAITGPPNFISDSCGAMAGLKLETSRGEILKGLIEAMTFYIRESFETLPGAGIDVTDFRAVGGGSKSDLWIQISADIFGRPFVRPKITEAGALGAAILAGVGCGVFASLESGVATMVHLDRTFEPDPKKQAAYDERFSKYQRFWPLMADYLRELA
ncbi:MAG: FGGY family carbohydrate kinase [Chloroflexi bacterium]|nr:FGGY family carbohydrate kinase [Chloroflexota bacterium]